MIQSDEPLAEIARRRIVPVIALDRAADALPLADALIDGGLPVAEVTFRTAAAVDAIRAMRDHGGLLVGAGTVLNVDTAKRAVDAGAQFVVSPGFNPKTVAWCLGQGITIVPGCSSATDLEAAVDHGLSVVKFFPAEAVGGLKLLKALAAPYSMLRFMPTGGITPDNLRAYLAFAPVIACGGSWMVTRDLLATQRFDEIQMLTRAAVERVG